MGILAPVMNKAHDLLIKLAISQPCCLIIPKSWRRYRLVFQTLADTVTNVEIKFALNGLVRRNDRLTSLSAVSEKKALGITDLLDAWTGEQDEGNLLQECLLIEDDTKKLTHLVLKWASSVYRQGKHRIYTGARLLRKLQHINHDIEPTIWTAVSSLAGSATNEEVILHQVVLELVRSKHFRIGRFLQHLISVGLPSPGVDAQDSALIRLLCSLPSQRRIGTSPQPA